MAEISASDSEVALLHRSQPLAVGFGVFKVQRIGGTEPGVVLLILTVVEQDRQASPRVQLEVMLAVGADLMILVQGFLPDNLAAAFAFQP